MKQEEAGGVVSRGRWAQICLCFFFPSDAIWLSLVVLHVQSHVAKNSEVELMQIAQPKRGTKGGLAGGTCT